MKGAGGKHNLRTRRRMERALLANADTLSDVIGNVNLGTNSDDFLLFELGRLIQDREPSFEDWDYRLLIDQGIRLHVSPNLQIRAQLVDQLRRSHPSLPASVRGLATGVIGAIEDSGFPLEKVGAIVRSYTSQLFQSLAELGDTSETEAAACSLIASWQEGSLDRAGLIERLRTLGPNAVPAAAEAMFESFDDTAVVDTALELLSELRSPVSARVLAYLVSEPVLEEIQEERARSILRDFWPLPRTYIYYKLREHSHEDIPFRWLELLVDVDDTRAADRILEEVVVHGRVVDYHEDLLAILSLLDRSRDPGLVGKLVRLVTEEGVPEPTVDLVKRWIEGSSLAAPVEDALKRWTDGSTIFVRQDEDFNAFAAARPEKSLDALRSEWERAFHESLGWQQRNRLPRGPAETQFDHELEQAMIQHLSLDPRLEESVLRDHVESFRENWLVTPRDETIPLVAVFSERNVDTPWLEEIYWDEINSWYVKAAQLFDEGNPEKAGQYLDIILEVEPEYPLARVLKALIEEET